MENKYISLFVLHALGDTIGYRNGIWEFNYIHTSSQHDNLNIDKNLLYQFIYDFISLGGINNINLEDWTVSDDTLLHIAIAKTLLKENDIVETAKKELLKMYDIAVLRHIGVTTKHSLELIKNNDFTEQYYESSGGNGCAMRTLCIGLAYYGEKNREKLIKISIETSKITHSNVIGYLGGFVGALFTAYAVENKEIETWVFLLIELLESSYIKKYINLEKFNEMRDYSEFVSAWKKYADIRFVNKKVQKQKMFYNLSWRQNFFLTEFKGFYDDNNLGGNGYTAPIFAYDCLLTSGNNWESLIFYSILNIGDSDTVGAIACGWYGILYGIDDVPKNNLKWLEYKNELTNLGKQFYKKFYNN